MYRKFTMLMVAMLVMVLLPSAAFVAAQEPDGHTTYRLNMRAGGGTTYDVIAVLPSDTALFFEGRTADLSWLLVKTADGVRGWVASLYVVFREGYGSPNALPVSSEVIAVAPPAAGNAGDAGGSDQAAQSIPASVNVTTLQNTPVVSGVGPRANEIFQRGQSMGNRPNVFTIVGGCNSLARGFMQPFGYGNYNLGSYSYLQPTIDFFNREWVDGAANSFMHKGVAVRAGYTAGALTDPSWADPQYCQGGESPLTCEFRRSQPAVALIMLGILDVYWSSPAQFEANLSQIVETSIQSGVIPVLTTFPMTTGEDSNNYGGVTSENERAVYRAEFNTIVVNMARAYGVPLLNLWQAARSVPNNG
ncbi:MAG: SH3 domain-containing protein, partial [Anaerolineae bacterium]|nr:SH3 domain-containing protein [Anaerolineae bacterium]